MSRLLSVVLESKQIFGSLEPIVIGSKMVDTLIVIGAINSV